MIAASLIEKETALTAEKMVSGVIANRLAIHMPLQIDASNIYALDKQYHGKIEQRILRLIHL